MQGFTNVLIIAQFLFTLVAGIYFYQSLKNLNAHKSTLKLDSAKELERINKLRAIKLTEPLSEKSRPESMEEVIGQEDGVKALRAALCSANPQHVLIYGPPGVGKTASARLILEEAKKNSFSPFQENAKFVEIDATTLRFDERSIADPLIGTVHDPIYQGAGAYGSAGVPQPKEGAVTKAHGGVLFIDEIGELHPVQMNKLLKVLEDRVVYFTSSYYSTENPNIPGFIHDIFKNGLPADFRLVGATTRNPEDIPPALRSRCTEIFFNDLKPEHIKRITQAAIQKTGFLGEEEVVEKVAEYADNGRDAVNIVQTASSVAFMESRKKIIVEDVEWVLESGRYSPRYHKKVGETEKIGVVNGLAVVGSGKGAVMEIEATVHKTPVIGGGILKVTGIVEEEEIKSPTGNIRRKSNAKASVENVMTALENLAKIHVKDYDIHINFPGGIPVDGPSAGIAIFSAVYSAVKEKCISPKIAMTGEISIQGKVLPVGGVSSKIQGAIEAGAEEVLIPEDNWQNVFAHYGVKVRRVKEIGQVLELLFGAVEERAEIPASTAEHKESINIMTAEGIADNGRQIS